MGRLGISGVFFCLCLRILKLSIFFFSLLFWLSAVGNLPATHSTFVPVVSHCLVRAWFIDANPIGCPILTYKRYCWSCGRGQWGRPYAGPVNTGLIFQMYWPSQRSCDGSLSDFHQNVIYCLCVSNSVIYSVLHSWTKHTPVIIQAGPFALQQRRPADCGHQAAWPRGLPPLCFHWPLFLLPPLWT